MRIFPIAEEFPADQNEINELTPSWSPFWQIWTFWNRILRIKKRRSNRHRRIMMRPRHREDKQYEDIEARIQYMYEKGESYGSFCSRRRVLPTGSTRLIMPSRYTPMTDMLINYQAIRQQVADLQIQLDEDKEELLRSKPATRSSRRPWRR